MNWWGKLLGGTFGFMIGGPLGALLGAAIGHNFDKGIKGLEFKGFDLGQQERAQTAFFTTTFLVMGHLAKVDGRVSESEIAVARTVMVYMQLTANQKQTAIHLFRQGKRPDFPLNAVLDQFRQECQRHPRLIRMFIEIQFNAAYADGVLRDAERALLLHICNRLGFSRFQFEVMDAYIRAQRQFGGAGGQRTRTGPVSTRPSLNQAYSMLGLKPEATDAEVKRAYRRLVSQHHPDKLAAKGLSEEMMRRATQKTHEINAAYERIKEARGL